MAADNNQELVDLATFALNHGIDSIREGGDLIPFALIEYFDKKRHLNRFVADRLEVGVAKAMEYIENLRNDPTVKRYAIAFSGYTTVEGIKYESIVVESGERDSELGYVVAQRFKREGIFKKFDLIGSPIAQPTQTNLISTKGTSPLMNEHPEFEFNNTFSEFGFSISYPKMSLEKSNSNGHAYDAESGNVGGRFYGSSINNHYFGLGWHCSKQDDTPQSILDGYFSGWTRTKVNRDPIKSINVNNLMVNYQTFTTQLKNGSMAYCVCGFWSIGGKNFILQVLGSDPYESYRLFNIYLSSFSYIKK
jgi:hypothetical protein